ncbi:MAG: class I SAM-dependent methyltransferase [Candidatus Sericytochromatia bacterium]|nr:class I SAM-dependent methyltransferase [Candidatus Sericytochromatia bacterium]
MQIKCPAGSRPYEALAAVYDMSGQSRFSLKMLGYGLELLALHRIRPGRVLDLACGTGAVAVALARRRFEVTGVDGSAAMLARARMRAERWNTRVCWQQADLTRLPERAELGAPEGFDLACCFYDSLNHLTDPEAFQSALCEMRRVLRVGGHLLFDLNTPLAYESVWGNSRDAHVGESYARFWQSHWCPDRRLATMDATYFWREDSNDATWQRISVRHLARGYTDEQVRHALARAGFEVLAAHAALRFDPVDGTTDRAAYLVRAVQASTSTSASQSRQ